MLVEQIGKWINGKFWEILGGTNTEVFYTLLVFLGVFLICILLVEFIQWLKYIRTVPPGPWGLPIAGYIPFVKDTVHLHYNELAKKYGTMFSVRLGSHLIVVLSDYRLIREAFRREEFTGRPHTDLMSIIDGYGKCQAQQASNNTLYLATLALVSSGRVKALYRLAHLSRDFMFRQFYRQFLAHAARWNCSQCRRISEHFLLMLVLLSKTSKN